MYRLFFCTKSITHQTQPKNDLKTYSNLFRTIFLSILLSIVFLESVIAAPSPTHTAKTEQTLTATDFLKTRVTQVLQLAAIPIPNAKIKAKIDAQLLTLIKPMMNFPAMSQASLGKHWKTRTPAERTRFISLFEELVFHSYIKKIRSTDSKNRVEYEDESSTSDGAIVEAVAITSQQEVELRFILKHHQNSHEMIYIAEDIVIDEVSLVQNYREQFNQIITQDGFDTLLKKMENQIAKVK